MQNPENERASYNSYQCCFGCSGPCRHDRIRYFRSRRHLQRRIRLPNRRGANNEEIAAQFTAGASGNLANVALGLTYRLGTDPAFRAVNVFLYGDASGSPDNANQTLLGSSTPIALFDGVTNNSVVSFSVAGTVPVTMGSLYYLVLKPTSLGTTDAWMLSSPIVTGAAFASFNDSTWAEGNSHILPAFRSYGGLGSS